MILKSVLPPLRGMAMWVIIALHLIHHNSLPICLTGWHERLVNILSPEVHLKWTFQRSTNCWYLKLYSADTGSDVC